MNKFWLIVVEQVAKFGFEWAKKKINKADSGKNKVDKSGEDVV